MDALPTRTLRLAGHRLDLERRALLDAAGVRVDLRPQALEVLCHLARDAGRLVTKEVLLAEVWPGMVVTDDSLVQAIGDIRRAIGDADHQVVQTVPRRGYVLVASASPHVDETLVAAPTTADAGPASPPARAAGEPLTSAARSVHPARLGLWLAVAVLVTGAVVAWQPWKSAGPSATPPAGSPDRPPIAVLDFSDPASPAEDQQVARAYAEDLVGELSRNADLRVISAYSSFTAMRGAAAGHEGLARVADRLGARYLIGGSLKREGERLRLSAQLIDGRDSRVVWTERHEIGANDVYAVRDTIVMRVAGSLHSSMRGNEEARMRQRPPSSLDVYELTLRAITLKHRFTSKDSREAKDLLERAIALDPGYAPAWLYLGFVEGIDAAYHLNGPPTPQRFETARAHLERSVALNPNLPAAYFGLAFVSSLQGRPREAVEAARRCVDLGPSDAECLGFLSQVLAYDGDVVEALRHSQLAMAMSPLPPSYMLTQRGFVLWANGKHEEALATLDRCLEQSPALLFCRVTRMVARVETGALEAARADAAALLKQAPTITADLFSQRFSANGRSLVERRTAAALKAGLPAAPTADAIAAR